MSVRAYKIEKTADSPSFNCWHDDQIMDIAELESFNDGGYLYIEKSGAKKLKSKLSKLKGQAKEDATETIGALNQVIKDCGENGGCEYICY